MINTALQWLEDGYMAVAIRQSLWLYPALEILHITGIVLLVGPAFMFDFRLLGFAKKIPVTLLANYLLPWSRRGLLLIIPSGILLFITNAATLGYDPVFWTKMVLLIIGGLNAIFFHRFTRRIISASGDTNPLPITAKLAAIISIIVWLSVITCGRLLAY